MLTKSCYGGLNKKRIKYILVMVLLIIAIIGALVGTSFALYNYSSSGIKENIIVTGSSEVKLKCDPISADTSGANNPENSLPSNMIPVCYNSEKNVWLKADSTNSDGDYRWYSYNNKVWANAVTVKNEGYVSNINEKGKAVNITNSLSAKYTSTNKGVKSTTSTATFTFTAGSTGEFSFDYSISSYGSSRGKLTVTVNGTVAVNGIYGVKQGTYVGNATAGTTYTIVAQYVKGTGTTYSDAYLDSSTIEGFVLPEGTTNFTHTKSSTYPWSETQQYLISLYKSYNVDTDTGTFNLEQKYNNNFDENSVGYYMCTDKKSTECSEIYEVKEVKNNIITKVNHYNSLSTTIRDDLLNAKVGTEIPMSVINTMFVWIPRYKAVKNGNYNGGTITNPGAFNITFVNTSSTAHGAFTFGTQALNGLWVGKFVTKPTIPRPCTSETCNVDGMRIMPDSSSAVARDKVSYYYYVSRSLESSATGHGFISSEIDSHMMKNSEWGAVAYLTQSMYGRCSSSTSCTEVYIDDGSYNYQGFKYEGGAKTINQDKTKIASTTGNIYGVYDMAGKWQYVMGNYNKYSGADSEYNSGFTGTLGSGGTYSGSAFPNTKYVDIYTTTSAYTNANLQHAYTETAGWYSDNYEFVTSSMPWVDIRGGGGTDADDGIFSVSHYDGQIEGSSFRITIVK